jgi:hypothetical protein
VCSAAALPRGGTQCGHQVVPGRFEPAAGCGASVTATELLQQSASGGASHNGQQAVELGARQFLAVVGGCRR